VPIKFVEFTNARTNKPVGVNPEHVRTAQPGSLQNNMIALAMGGEGQDVAVEGDLKSVLEILRGERDGPSLKTLLLVLPKRLLLSKVALRPS
jgi:hypothetical protein